MKLTLAALLIVSTSVFAQDTIEVTHRCYSQETIVKHLYENKYELVFNSSSYRNKELTYSAWANNEGHSIFVGTLGELTCVLAEGDNTKFLVDKSKYF
jgi:hypothetical protein